MKTQAKSNPVLYRQGDVLLRRIEKIPADAKPQDQTTRLTLALGEVTGHAHVLVMEQGSETIAPYRDESDTVFFDIMVDAFLRHDEHSALTIPAGTYEVVRQREYHPAEIRTVAD